MRKELLRFCSFSFATHLGRIIGRWNIYRRVSTWAEVRLSRRKRDSRASRDLMEEVRTRRRDSQAIPWTIIISSKAFLSLSHKASLCLSIFNSGPNQYEKPPCFSNLHFALMYSLRVANPPTLWPIHKKGSGHASCPYMLRRCKSVLPFLRLTLPPPLSLLPSSDLSLRVPFSHSSPLFLGGYNRFRLSIYP